jgi:serine/threonine protein kinase
VSLFVPFCFQVFSEGKMTKASDVYSFGIVMYEMLTWLIPFEDEDSKGPQMPRILFSSRRPTIPPDDQLYGGAPPGRYKELMEVRLVHWWWSRHCYILF